MSKVLAMDPTVELFWVPKLDRELAENEQFRIKYKNLTARDEAKINDQMIKSVTKGKKSTYEYLVSTADLKRCELVIKGWENFSYPVNHPTKAGMPVPFSVENIGMIPASIRSEFNAFITDRKEAEDDETEDTDLGEAKAE